MKETVRSEALVFAGPRSVRLEIREVLAPGPQEVLVESIVSAISAGTEMLVYRDEMPAGMVVDETIGALRGTFAYPLRYGYAVVGRVVTTGEAVSDSWKERLVFAFHPHESRFVARPEALVPVPAGVSAEAAAFLPNMETAVSFLMDGQPVIGERVAIFGQGIVGLLTTALAAGYPLARLVTVDGYSRRREWSRRLGASQVVNSEEGNVAAEVRQALGGSKQTGTEAGADLVYELSGNPAALQEAVEVSAFGGRIVVGSWYGQKEATLALGGRFHRSQLRLISSQVSHLGPGWQGRWTKARRLAVAWEMVREKRPEQLVSHRFSLREAQAAYGLVDERPEEVLQVLLTY